LFHVLDKIGVSSRVELVLYAASSAKSVQTAAVHSRHCFASNLVMAGVDLRATAQL
jgi:site-specific recombinase XerD